MQVLAGSTIPAAFLQQLHIAPSSLLLLDYDGTLAPFRTERNRAFPYPQVVPLLEKIIDTGRSRVVIVSGRPVAELPLLLEPLRPVEVWGSHGCEHLTVDGMYTRAALDSETTALLSDAAALMEAAGMAERLERKPGGVAVHWRGLAPAEAEELGHCAYEGLMPYAQSAELQMLKFDGGVELRVRHPNKGDAVESILRRLDPGIPVAYLGDDHTDEAAFRVLNGRGLTVHVRPERRETEAQVWLRPPDGLIDFLQQWLDALRSV